MRFPARPPPLYSILVVGKGLGGYHTSTINHTVAHVMMRFPAPLPPLYSNVGGGHWAKGWEANGLRTSTINHTVAHLDAWKRSERSDTSLPTFVSLPPAGAVDASKNINQCYTALHC